MLRSLAEGYNRLLELVGLRLILGVVDDQVLPLAKRRPTLQALGLVLGWPWGTITNWTLSEGRAALAGLEGLGVILFNEDEDF